MLDINQIVEDFRYRLAGGLTTAEAMGATVEAYKQVGWVEVIDILLVFINEKGQ